MKNFFSMDRPEHHSIDRLKERGVKKGSGRHSTLRGLERSVFNRTNIVTVSRATLGRLLRRRSAYEPFRALRCHLELKLKLDVSMTIHYWPVLVTSTEYNYLLRDALSDITAKQFSKVLYNTGHDSHLVT